MAAHLTSKINTDALLMQYACMALRFYLISLRSLGDLSSDEFKVNEVKGNIEERQVILLRDLLKRPHK